MNETRAVDPPELSKGEGASFLFISIIAYVLVIAFSVALVFLICALLDI